MPTEDEMIKALELIKKEAGTPENMWYEGLGQVLKNGVFREDFIRFLEALRTTPLKNSDNT